jgi:hypothetical protein
LRSRAAQLDVDRELAILALGDVAFRVGAMELATKLFDAIPSASPRREGAQLAAVDAEAWRNEYARAAARLEPFVHPSRRRIRVAPTLTTAVLEVPDEDADIEAQEAWFRLVAQVTDQSWCEWPQRKPALPDYYAPLEKSFLAMDERTRRWRASILAEGTPPAFAAWFARQTADVDRRLAEMRREEQRLRRKKLGEWGTVAVDVLAAAEESAEAERKATLASARKAAVERIGRLATPMMVLRFGLDPFAHECRAR